MRSSQPHAYKDPTDDALENPAFLEPRKDMGSSCLPYRYVAFG